jgi:hypothetical protein
MNKEQTLDFIREWNTAMGFSNEISEEPNMRYVSVGFVTWNEYDAPEISIELIVRTFNKVMEKS